MQAYEDPTIIALGSVEEMTEAKCNGSGDATFPQLLADPDGPEDCGF